MAEVSRVRTARARSRAAMSTTQVGQHCLSDWPIRDLSTDPGLEVLRFWHPGVGWRTGVVAYPGSSFL